VFFGLAIKNTAVQPLLDGVCANLASLSEREVLTNDTTQPANAPQVELVLAGAAPLVALAFKLEEGRFGQLTFEGGPVYLPWAFQKISLQCATGNMFTDGTSSYFMGVQVALSPTGITETH
jgi:hypothetical protein